MNVNTIEENEEFEFFINIISMNIFLACIGLALFIYWKKRTLSSIFLILLMVGAFLFSLGEYLDEVIKWRDADDFVESFTVFLATILLLIGTVIILEERLKEVDKVRTDFIRRASHELKTPLNSITSITEYLLDTYKDEMNDEILKMVELINRGGLRLNKLTENLLNVLKMTSGNVKVEKKKENITNLLKSCINDISYLAKQRKIIIKSELDKDVLFDIDSSKLENVFVNILSNALKNTPTLGIIYVKLSNFDDRIEIKFSDTGVGITEKEKEVIFKRFGKIERNGEGLDIITEGSGLGLFISKEIINLHKGTITAESEGRNKGTTFIIRIPRN